MTKIKNGKKSKYLNLILVAVVILVVIGVIILNGDIEVTWDAIIHADYSWIANALGVWFVFMLLDSAMMKVFFLQQGVHLRFHDAIVASLIGMFYSNITPAATGGQPMQVLSLKRKGVHPGVGSSCLAVKFFCWQTALLLVGTVLWVANPDAGLPGGMIPFVVLGYVLNGAAVVVVFLLVISPRAVTKLVNGVLRIGVFFHLVKDEASSRKKLEHSIEEFNASVDMIKNHPLRLLWLLGISVLQVVALMSITYCVYRAMGLVQGEYVNILTIQTLLYIAVSFFPLPGAAGAQELGFGGFFGGVFGEKTSAALLIWRFFTYYVMLLFGLGGTIEDSVYVMRRGKASNILEGIERNAENPEEGPEEEAPSQK